MREQGRSTFSVDESGWCLDRWAGLHEGEQTLAGGEIKVSGTFVLTSVDRGRRIWFLTPLFT